MFEERLSTFRLMRLLMDPGTSYILFDWRFRFSMSVLREMVSGKD